MIEWQPKIETRENKANNIFGISTCRYTHRYGQIGEDNLKNDHLAIMPDIPKGIYATLDLIYDHYLFYGVFNPVLLGNKWSGDKTDQYGFDVAKISKLVPFGFYSFKTKGDIFMRALAIMENGDPERGIPEGFIGQFIKR